MAHMELSKAQVTDQMVEYVKAKYGYSWLESDEMSDEMFEDLCRFAKEEEVSKDTNSKGKEVDASHAQPVSTLGNKSPKPSKMDTNVVLGLLAAKKVMKPQLLVDQPLALFEDLCRFAKSEEVTQRYIYVSIFVSL
ncbi:hypothetical protein CTI12_AA390290 [Artemisia annua]|uniref:Uncharacterized protein n=1 Tax=Artemisia annua TaxID=35608 RepID=A0A2U1MEA9_ARTAN|nr:hypothetical protein CTI12_AA390290 [Artemisia annua]